MWWSTGSPAASPPVRARARRSDSAQAAGFTLIEILVAFAIAALLLGGLLQLFSTGLYSSGRVGRQVEATLLAESALEELGRLEPLVDGTAQRRVLGRYWVQVGVQRRDDLIPSDAPASVIPYAIDISVGWLEGRRQRLVSLQTIRLGGAR